MNTVLEVTEQVTHTDSGTYRVYSFEVPDKAAELRLDFVVEPREIGDYAQAVKVVLFGPDGLRGTPGRNALPALLTSTTATPGFVSGPLTSGVWRAEVSLEYILKGQPCSYMLRVGIEHAKPDVPVRSSPARTQFDGVFPASVEEKGGPSWYAGDLHMHTSQSDGQWSPGDLVGAIRRRGLDFFVVTDHNIQWALPEVAAELEAQGVESILAIPGVEVSTRCGHLLAIGSETWIDWRLGRWPDRLELTIGEIVERVHAAGALAIIAHPGAVGSPYCHGCQWELDDVDPRTIDAVEVWNGPWLSEPEENERSLRYWEKWREQGYSLPFTGGSDAHGGQIDFKEHVPTTYVYARALTRTAILDGLRGGHVVVSCGPILRFNGIGGRDSLANYGPGDTIQITIDTYLEATVSEVREPARLILRGQVGPVAEQLVEGHPAEELLEKRQGKLSINARDLAPGWYLAEVRSMETGALLAIANPITLRQ